MMDGRCCNDTSQFLYIIERGKKLVERESLEFYKKKKKVAK
jgi:hypothetical protein